MVDPVPQESSEEERSWPTIGEGPRFVVPAIHDNPTGWGPVSSTPLPFAHLPYAPFSKTDRLGPAMFFGHQNYQKKGVHGSTPSQSGFGYVHDEDSFSLVDTRPSSQQKPRFHFAARRPFGRGGGGYRDFRSGGGQRWGGNQQRGGSRGGRGGWSGGAGGGDRFQRRWHDRSDRQRALRMSSIEVKPDWKLEVDMSLTDLTRLAPVSVEPAEDIVQAGRLGVYSKTFDRITTRTEKPLLAGDRPVVNLTTSEDPIIRELVEKEHGDVFGTDLILSVLMSAPRAVASWDIIANRVGNQLFFDKREGSGLDAVSVSETAHEPLAEDKDHMNSAQSLSREATAVNQMFSQQILMKETRRFEKDYPSKEPTGHLYRRVKIDDVSVIMRCDVDAVLDAKGEALTAKESFLVARALVDFDPSLSGVDWRQKLDSQHGAVLATELKNNSNKLSQWAVQANLSNAQMKVGYISRVSPKNNASHVILGVQTFKPREFANQVNVDLGKCWAILKSIIDQCLALPEGKYVLLKDPNHHILQIFSVTDDSFEDVARE